MQTQLHIQIQLHMQLKVHRLQLELELQLHIQVQLHMQLQLQLKVHRLQLSLLLGQCSPPLTSCFHQARAALRRCQTSLHRWGAANKVTFDPGKESFHAIHRTRSFGDDFKILGVLFDCQLTMRSAAQEIAREAGWKAKALLRCRRFYSQGELVKLY